MSPNSRLGGPFGNSRHSGSVSAWTMAIVFATVAVVSFAVDQTVSLSSNGSEEFVSNPPSVLHPIQLIQSVIDAASE